MNTSLSQGRFLPTMVLLVLANLVPVYLVLDEQWTVSQLVLLFWSENVIIGLFNILKMLSCQPAQRPRGRHTRSTIAFFAIHYGGFTLVHGVFVVVFFFMVEFDNGSLAGDLTLADTLHQQDFWWALLVLLISHGFSYVWHFIMGNERLGETPESLLFKPYGRVIVLHITIILGAWLTAMFQQPIWALLLLVGLKILVDIAAHYASHR